MANEALAQDPTKHTSGPWTVEKWSGMQLRIHAVEGHVATVHAGLSYSLAEGKANARLVSAAPDLLEALEWLWREVRESGNANATDFRWPQAREKTIAALEKARG